MAEQPTADRHAIITKDLTKKFGDFTAVDHITFSVRRGEIFGFLGPNGAGKTTTIRMLLGLLRPTEGTAWVLGYDIRGDVRAMRSRIGYMSQRFTLYRDLTVDENLNFYGQAYGVRGERLRRRKAEIVQMAGLVGRERELTKNLAGGWRQRLALGCAMVHEPELLFLDEPTAGMDPVSRRAFWDLLYELAEGGTTIFVTTHYMDEAEHCHRLAFIYAGRIVAMGSPQEIKETVMQGQVLEIDCDRPDRALQLLRAMGSFDEVALYGALIHVVAPEVDRYRGEIRARLTGEGIAVHSMDVIAPSLEDVFISSVRQQERQAG
ncbi:MAG: ABC transporter ATP-binding protein [Chloroflexi bacterium]|nr:MAG: ABC transporter ATP-binding protein [Chloroflexota bacterium]